VLGERGERAGGGQLAGDRHHGGLAVVRVNVRRDRAEPRHEGVREGQVRGMTPTITRSRFWHGVPCGEWARLRATRQCEPPRYAALTAGSSRNLAAGPCTEMRPFSSTYP